MDCYLCLDKNLMNIDEFERWTLTLIFKVVEQFSWRCLEWKFIDVTVHLKGTRVAVFCSPWWPGMYVNEHYMTPREILGEMSLSLWGQRCPHVTVIIWSHRIRVKLSRKEVELEWDTLWEGKASCSQVTTWTRTLNLTALIHSLRAYQEEPL